MSSHHIPDELLIEYADDPRSHPEIDEHLGACTDCWNALSFYRTLTAELREEEMWSSEEEARFQRGQRTVREFAERIAAEDAEARRLLDGVIDSPYRFARARIPARKRFRTGGVVRLLCEAVREECKNEGRAAEATKYDFTDSHTLVIFLTHSRSIKKEKVFYARERPCSRCLWRVVFRAWRACAELLDIVDERLARYERDRHVPRPRAVEQSLLL